MLDPWIIEQIRRREEEERRRDDRAILELPLHEMPLWPPRQQEAEKSDDDDEVPTRGVVIIGM